MPPGVNLQWESPQLYDYLPLECPYLRSRLLLQRRHCLSSLYVRADLRIYPPNLPSPHYLHTARHTTSTPVENATWLAHFPRDTIRAMKKSLLHFLLLPLLLTACLELTPNVSTDFSEIEARATFESEVRRMCDHKKSRIPAILRKIKEAEALPNIDFWTFNVGEMEAQVFPSGIITGEYHRHIQESLCR